MTRLVAEVRSSFDHEDEIDLISVQKLTYMMAVLNEALRIFPPVPIAIPRKAPAGGDTICGRYVPPGVCLPIISSPRNLLISYLDNPWNFAMACIPQSKELHPP